MSLFDAFNKSKERQERLSSARRALDERDLYGFERNIRALIKEGWRADQTVEDLLLEGMHTFAVQTPFETATTVNNIRYALMTTRRLGTDFDHRAAYSEGTWRPDPKTRDLLIALGREIEEIADAELADYPNDTEEKKLGLCALYESAALFFPLKDPRNNTILGKKLSLFKTTEQFKKQQERDEKEIQNNVRRWQGFINALRTGDLANNDAHHFYSMARNSSHSGFEVPKTFDAIEVAAILMKNSHKHEDADNLSLAIDDMNVLHKICHWTPALKDLRSVVDERILYLAKKIAPADPYFARHYTQLVFAATSDNDPLRKRAGEQLETLENKNRPGRAPW